MFMLGRLEEPYSSNLPPNYSVPCADLFAPPTDLGPRPSAALDKEIPTAAMAVPWTLLTMLSLLELGNALKSTTRPVVLPLQRPQRHVERHGITMASGSSDFGCGFLSLEGFWGWT